MKKYHLMNKDNRVADIVGSSVLGSTNYTLGSVYGLLPYGFTDAGKWLESRQAAKHRKHIKELMRQCNCETIEGYIKVIHCTSINDTFWVKSEEEDIVWRDVSLYTNEFNDVIAKLAFEGAGLFGEQFSSTSPEFGTAGMYQKCCTKGLDNEMFLYKRGDTPSANTGFEPYCEALSSELYSIITKNSVHYDLVSLHGAKASRCKIFTNENIGLVQYGTVSDVAGTGAINYYDKFGDANKFRAMLVADAVCFNEDRHSGNHGLLFNNDTLELIGMAPVYDNNRTLLFNLYIGDTVDIDEYMRDHTPCIGSNWVNVAREALTSELKSTLINLQGYEIKFDCDDKFTKDRLHIVNSMINHQIKLILNKGLSVSYAGVDLSKFKTTCSKCGSKLL